MARMSRGSASADDGLVPSLLDRLIDDEPGVSTEPGWKRLQGLGELKESVRRDLMNLLNTRRTWLQIPEGFEEGAQSILAYGVPEITNVLMQSLDEREGLRRSLEEAIARFEPRLIDVFVLLRDPDSEGDRTLHLIVNGRLRLDPNPEPVTFDAAIETTTGDCKVETVS